MTVDLAVRSAMLLLTTLVLSRGLVRASAATRHAFWRAAMVAVLLLPIVASLAPTWTVRDGQPVERSRTSLPSSRSADGGATIAGVDATRPDGAAATLASMAEALSRQLDDLKAIGGLVWWAGLLMTAAHLSLGYVGLWRIRRRAQPAPLAWTASALKLASRLGLRSVPNVLVSHAVPGPLVAGLMRTVVVIPPDAAEWPESRREAVLVHELSHIARRDLQAQAVAHAVCALYWFNPLAWAAARAMRRERELACDDAVLQSGVAPTSYAAELLVIATDALHRRAPAAALSMARPSEIEGRLISVLARRPRHMTALARWGMPAMIALTSVAVAGAGISDAPTVGSHGLTPTTHAASIVNPPLVPAPPADDRREPVDASAPDRQTRERSVLALALTSGNSVVPALHAALDDDEGRVREKAVVGLMWRRDPRVVPALIEAAADADSRVREKAIVALALSGDARARPAVDAARTDPDPQVRQKASTLRLALLPFVPEADR